MRCRVCGSPAVRKVGQYRPYTDYTCAVHDCGGCGCRFVPHEASVYERLHAGASSAYAGHEEMARRCGVLFDAGDAAGLAARLSAQAKFRFVLEALADLPAGARVLEVGCSRGALSAGLIARGLDVLGVDASATAVGSAIERFGDRFVVAGDRRVAAGAPYDAVVHVGTIGCVEQPIAMTRELLAMLGPGGRLVFNAPDVRAARQRRALWCGGTAPPDLVTLFDERFWGERFGHLARVSVTHQVLDPGVRFMLATGRVLGRSPARRHRCAWLDAGDGARPPRWARAARAVGRRVGRFVPLPDYRADFGQFVVMTRKAKPMGVAA